MCELDVGLHISRFTHATTGEPMADLIWTVFEKDSGSITGIYEVEVTGDESGWARGATCAINGIEGEGEGMGKRALQELKKAIG